MVDTERFVWFERHVHPFPGDPFDGSFEVIGPDNTNDAFAGISRAHGGVASQEHYSGAVFDLAPKLIVLARTGIGIETIDLEAATSRGIAVCNTPDGPTISTAEHTIAMMLAVAKSLQPSAEALRAGEKDLYSRHEAIELAGTTLGLVGYGRIARRVARAAEAIGMYVVAYDPHILPDAFDVKRADSFGELLRMSDTVSIHVPLTEATYRLFDADAFALMKPGAVLINTSRGGVVDQESLLGSIISGHLFGAGLDVTEPEPLPPDHPLLHHDRIIVTPHVASGTLAGKQRIFGTAIAEVARVLNGREPHHLVNTDVVGRWQERRSANR
ncbi:MAG: NAD(P)-dependent oxidoreductase [Acidimicrobiia bacterium]